ncbi:hypothetical protein N7462_008179 [Penicillium macrosclerotiorum]|uniref:uncharacterized protein n=1 Tax=Penicillium macrosclerotiorum TaxID=303699 RepID=UPI00254931CA|nr:uncharacterized protein N7462_008179 [Penicillium macrosclerotiorum]KAJ5679935.1 hypothetical protein N7462_008179 [Penicillium macrosclerotiorum]
MLNTLELPFSPSCYDSLAWSPDGELAVANGEQVQILTSKHTGRDTQQSQSKDQWQMTRVRVNAFTNAEWPPIYPQNRDDFSIGAEMSNSTVVGLAWSPPGLARFRRSVLAVLTSNLLLSLWEPLGTKGQWTRVAIVNHSLQPAASTPSQLEGLELRRSNIRSFHWCPPLYAPPSRNTHSAPEPETRWGAHLLLVANDANEVILLRIRRSAAEMQPSLKSYTIEKVALYQVNPEQVHYPIPGTGSLLQKALQSKARLSSISCGPWVASPEPMEDSDHSVVATTAVISGAQLYVIKMTASLRKLTGGNNDTTRYETRAKIAEHPMQNLSANWSSYYIHGPLLWASTVRSAFFSLERDFSDVNNQPNAIVLNVGINAGFLTLAITPSIYDGTSVEADRSAIREWAFSNSIDENGEASTRFVEPISSMTTFLDDRSGICSLHVGTVGGLGSAIYLDHLETGDLSLPRWNKLMVDRQEQYDLDRDLGGQSVARIWGLASYRNAIAVLFSKHPTDMVEYRVASDEKSTLIFSSEDPEYPLDLPTLFAPNETATESWSAQDQREAAIAFLLSSTGQDGTVGAEDRKLVYAAACCAIVDQQNESIRSQAKESFEWLASLTGADLNEEILQCSVPSPSICSKSPEQFSGPGGHLFERCEICDAGIAWESSKEAQCIEGHLFGNNLPNLFIDPLPF